MEKHITEEHWSAACDELVKAEAIWNAACEYRERRWLSDEGYRAALAAFETAMAEHAKVRRAYFDELPDW